MERITQIRTPTSSSGSNHCTSNNSNNNTLTRTHSPHSPRGTNKATHGVFHLSSTASGSSGVGGGGVADMASSVATLLSSPAKHSAGMGGGTLPLFASSALAMASNHNHSAQPDLVYHVRQVQHSLKHFRDVVAKNKLEMLPGNGTVVLDTVNTVIHVLKSLSLNEHNAALISATTLVYLSLGRMIKLCDEVLLMGDCGGSSSRGAAAAGDDRLAEGPCAALSAANVAEVVDEIERAIENLVRVAGEQIAERQQNGATAEKSKATEEQAPAAAAKIASVSSNTLQRPSLEGTAAGQRTSLPDIALTPW